MLLPKKKSEFLKPKEISDEKSIKLCEVGLQYLKKFTFFKSVEIFMMFR